MRPNPPWVRELHPFAHQADHAGRFAGFSALDRPHVRKCQIFLLAVGALEARNGALLIGERRFPFTDFSVLMKYALVPQAILAREGFPCDSS